MTANHYRSTSLVLLGMLLGCGAGAATTYASAQHADNPSAARWQQMCLGPSSSVSGISDDVAKAGTKGWELVAMHEGITCFKRPAP